jgi:hypothetical protein
MESADAVRQLINTANDDILKEIRSTEQLQQTVYNDFLDLLTNENFFAPLLQSKSKELVGRFCIHSRISVHATYQTSGAAEYLDSPGHFEIEFTSSGLANVSSSWDQYFSQSLTTNLSPYVQNTVRFGLSTKGWKCWWANKKFMFQPAMDAKLIEESILLASLYSSRDAPRTEAVHRSPLLLDLSMPLNM